MQAYNRLRPETVALLSSSGAYSEKKENIGEALLLSGALDMPGILAQTIVELLDDCEYCLTSISEEDLRNQSSHIRIRRLFDWKETEIPREELLAGIRESPTFDQLSLRAKE